MLIGLPIPRDCEVRGIPNVPQPDSVMPCEAKLSEGTAIVRFAVAPQSGGGNAEAVLSGVRAFYFGAPNDEALKGHRLWGRGLSQYSLQEVIHSDWIADLERRNRVHPRHSERLFAGLRHFIFTFKEETLECVARALEIKH
jgi:hypothetical protein